MSLEELRSRHLRLHYHEYSIERTRGHTILKFVFELEPGIRFTPQLVLHAESDRSDDELALFAFHVGLAELPSYWKAACPKEIRVHAGTLNPDQCSWWQDLLLHGLGEFYFRNQIDFTRPDFLIIQSSLDAPKQRMQALPPPHGGMVLTAGGKDSSLTLELLKEQKDDLVALVLNPTRAALESANISGYRHPLVLRRSIDPTLLRLNEQGYLNGHTPFSSYLAFASVFAAAAIGRKDIIVSNEYSANESNVTFHDLPINHQYSKSARFERMFRQYVQRHLSPTLNYFSFLRPLYDLQVAGLFARTCKPHFSNFRSCNVGSKQDRWCGTCPKCVFTYIALAAFLPFSQLREIFAGDFTTDPEFETQLRGLIGLDAIKPFECVGTRDESLQALRLMLARAERRNEVVPAVLSRIYEQSRALPCNEILLRELQDEHFLADYYLDILEDAVSECFHDF